VNEKKTRRCSLPEETFTFLGFTFGRRYSTMTGRAYVAAVPSKKKVQSVCDKIGEATIRSTLGRDADEQVGKLNQILLGWANYFRLGPVTAAWCVVQNHACRRLRQWLQRKHRGRVGTVSRYPNMNLYEDHGLVMLDRRVRRLSLWAKA
jgi:RNA-directed DNA polymerase